MINLTPALLRRATECDRPSAERAAPHLHAACALYGITTPARVAAFLAQLAVESGRFRYLRELADGSAYEGKASLGNTEPGDGQRYRGRGWIQITGRANYRDTAARMRRRLPAMQVPDFEADPEALEDPRWASLASADWWEAHGLNEIADLTLEDGRQIDRISRAINRGNPDTDRPANHETERRAAWILALSIMQSSEAETLGHATQPSPGPGNTPNGPPDAAPMPSDQYTQEGNMPLPALAIVKAVLPTVVSYLPQLGKIFGSGSEVSERNIKAAEIVGDVLVKATNAANVQDAAEKIASDPQARQAASEALSERWYELAEAGGGGIDGARKADAAARATGDIKHSPSFWFTMAVVPLLYLIVGSVVGLWGKEWPAEVRSAIATAVVSLIAGGAAGYYWGTATTRNRTTGATQ